jgi:lysophospholipase L1-like esterase
MRRLAAGAIAAAWMIGAGVAQAAEAAGPDQCAYVKPAPPAMAGLLARVREMALKPGAKADMASLAAMPGASEVTGWLNEQEAARKAADWANLCRYKAANAALRGKTRPRAVFLGDSITENWGEGDPALFTDGVVDRGISGQTTSQILLRVYSDVIALRPAVMHIMAGTNDVARNTGPIGDEDIVDNIRAMIDVAQANGVRVVLASIPPMAKVSWNPAITDAGPRIARLNGELRSLAAARGVIFVDYYDALKSAEGGMRPELANDGVHPNRDGYALMRPLTLRALEQARRGGKGVVQ